jgi:hypothetical protein
LGLDLHHPGNLVAHPGDPGVRLTVAGKIASDLLPEHEADAPGQDESVGGGEGI